MLKYYPKYLFKMKTRLKTRLYEIIFKADTPLGKIFDVFLLILICLSVIAVIMESVHKIESRYGEILNIIEWTITFSFTIEYFLRIWVVKYPSRYIFSFYGIIDLLAILPSFIGLILAGAQGLMVIRALRLIRVFRLFKLTRYTTEGNTLIRALKASRAKISVFLFAVFTVVIIIGTLMYLVEGEENGFTSIPKGIYWAIVTLTTVGYGDVVPTTNLGQFIASFVMILGYGIIAVPTGIVTAEIIKVRQFPVTTQKCSNCLKEGHEKDSYFCRFCGEKLKPEKQ